MTAEKGLIQAVYDEIGPLKSALDRLLRAGFEATAMEIRSSVPLPAGESLPGVRVRSRALGFAVAGGLAGGLTAFLVASLSAKAYPLVTGGMPIVAPFPVGILTYEGTALGAILAVVATVFLEARLRPRWRGQVSPLDHHVAEGKILLSVILKDERELAEARKALLGALEVRDPGEGLE